LLYGSTIVAYGTYLSQGRNGMLSIHCPTHLSFFNVPRNQVTFVRHLDDIPEDVSTMLPLHRVPNMGTRETMTWDLAWRYHRRYGQEFWAQHGVKIFTKFVELSEELKPEGYTPRSRAVLRSNPEAWEMACDAYVTELLQSSLPSITAQ
jgi:hypothetical protein